MFLDFYAEITLIRLNKKSTHFQHGTLVYRFIFATLGYKFHITNAGSSYMAPIF